ncbi:MAG: carboxypeptidase-like regulatory domain-containing protein [Kofleriaceae bacterium]
MTGSPPPMAAWRQRGWWRSSTYATTTAADGSYRLDDVPDGTYQLVVWHPPVARVGADGVVVEGEPVVVRRTVTVVANAASRVDVALP